MASLIEVLIDTLNAENDEYVKILKISQEKTPILVKGDVEALREIVAKEQVHVDRVANLEKKRVEAVNDIATVLNKDADTLTVKEIIDLLKGQDEVQNKLIEAHAKIKATLNDVVAINEINKNLIRESLEMVEFNINLINSFKKAPEVNTYTKNAYNVNAYTEPPKFDAKN
ncbi:MAG: flagellar protein FlgN [Lachnospiraceae bacterium]|nr:flagellar protein FlgN [Lachnospiraceae bacterium]MBQ4068821.1 flagellar protein FlgN [Lachnospiraceae bacterium]